MAHIGVVLSAPWMGAFLWTLVASCMRTEAKRRGLQLSYESAVTVPDHARMLNELLDQGVDALVFRPMSTSDAALLALLDRAKAAGVPVITLDSLIEHPAVVCTVGSDNDASQALITEVAFRALGHRGRVMHFQGDLRQPSGIARNASFHRVLAQYPNIELIHEVMLDWVTPRSRVEFGAETMRAMIAAGRLPDAIISANDEAAIGAIRVIQQAGLEGKIIVTGFDGLAEALLAIRDGTMLATINQVPELIAEKAFDAALAAIQSAELPRILHVDTELITRDNVMETALDALRQVPQFIFNLSHGQQVQRELQQAVIAKQSKILSTVSAVSSVLASMREPQKMMQNLVDLLCQDFMLHRAMASPAVDNPLFVCCTRSLPAGDAGEGDHPELRLPLVSAGKPLGELELQGANAKSFDPPDRRDSGGHRAPSRNSTRKRQPLCTHRPPRAERAARDRGQAGTGTARRAPVVSRRPDRAAQPPPAEQAARPGRRAIAPLQAHPRCAVSRPRSLQACQRHHGP
ncbi:MAG: sugar ABC transporter substrate-binding protein [Rhizobacter sp.]